MEGILGGKNRVFGDAALFVVFCGYQAGKSMGSFRSTGCAYGGIGYVLIGQEENAWFNRFTYDVQSRLSYGFRGILADIHHGQRKANLKAEGDTLYWRTRVTGKSRCVQEVLFLIANPALIPPKHHKR